MTETRFPAISVRQPWADLISWGLKDIENRSKRTYFRGTILLHASATKPEPTLIEAVQKGLRKDGVIGKREIYEPVFGQILGMIDIVDCITKSDSEWFDGPYGWCLANPVMFDKEIPYKGAVGIFYVPRSVLKGTPAARKVAGASLGKP